MKDGGITSLQTTYTKGNTKFRVEINKSDGQWRPTLFIGGARQGPIRGATSPDLHRVLHQVALYMHNGYGFHSDDHLHEGSADPGLPQSALPAPTLTNLRDHFRPVKAKTRT